MKVDRRALLIVGALSGCSSHAPVEVRESKSDVGNRDLPRTWPSRCANVVQALAEGRLSDLQPLPEACPLDEVLKERPDLGEEDAGGRLGRRRGEWRATRENVAGSSLRVWHIDQNVVLLDLASSELDEEWPAMRDELGAPAAKLDYYDETRLVAGGLWVYPEKGLAAFTAADGEIVDRIEVFAPTTAERYRDELAIGMSPLVEVPFRE